MEGTKTMIEKNTVLPISESELNERIQKNYARLTEPYYQIDQVFAPAEYDWPGDKEGRALLAFVCHARMTGQTVPCLPLMRAELDSRTNERDFFGPLSGDTIFEQQLSGHSWYLRGLCAAYRLYGDADDLRRMKNVFEGLYLPTAGHFGSYPVIRENSGGEVSGHSAAVQDGWRLSTDIGCAFMSIDGLSDYYEVTHDDRALELLGEMTEIFDLIDKVALQAQTHCTLTAARGMLRLYKITQDRKYMGYARRIWNTYIDSGMTYTYQNYNWWGKGDTWTEPCAIVDSVMVALELYKLDGDESALTVARRIWHNGMASAQRPNGGAGTDNTVGATCDILASQMYEAFFCCTMRLAEGLLCVKENRELLTAQLTGNLEADERGVYSDGDIIYAELLPCENANMTEEYGTLPELSMMREVDGHKLIPLVKYYRVSEELVPLIRQRVRF